VIEAAEMMHCSLSYREACIDKESTGFGYRRVGGTQEQSVSEVCCRQGVVVQVLKDNLLLLDDGTGVIAVESKARLRHEPITAGDYLEVVGSASLLAVSSQRGVGVCEATVVPLRHPDQEALWFLEVLDAQLAEIPSDAATFGLQS
jgi:hypothetical protein